ncbi:hypothetical protein GCM10009654_36850 [Streptomyces hebeiensis]|uniref:Uncharacterized protein n=1 Tax=Streptomyces hebeiensis TaxID=229486 RepID=A0ABN1UYD7_9ACTN
MPPAALSESSKYIQYEDDPPPCDRTHQTPPAPPFGRTALLSQYALGRIAKVPPDNGCPVAAGTPCRSRHQRSGSGTYTPGCVDSLM